MHRARVGLVAAAAAALTVAAVVSGQQAAPAAPSRIEKVKDGLYVIRGPFNRCAPNGCGAYGDDGFLHEAGDVAVRVTSEGLILVDDKYQENVADVLDKVKSVSTLPVKYLLNTHHHTDHAGGNESFVKLTEVRAYHFGRGHTDGDTVVYFPDLKVIHTGDLITEGMPVLDYRNGASAVEWVSVLDKVLELDFDVVIPGHGPLMTKAQVKTDRDKLVKMNERMTALVRKGVPKESAFAQLGLADLGWDKTVSTVAFTGGVSGYYDEMKARLGK